MKDFFRQTISVPRWRVFVSLGVTAFAVMLAIYCVGDLPDNQVWTLTKAFGTHLMEAILIGALIGFFVNRWLSGLVEPGLDTTIRSYGIQKIYSSRIEAMEDLLASVKDPHNRLILIAGLSLRDFLTPRGSLQIVWEAIWQRLESEQHQDLSTDKRLHVRCLLLDPLSGEGRFRSQLEKALIGEGGLDSSVMIGIDQVQRMQSKIYGDSQQAYLQIRLYEHCPFAFNFVTDDFAFVEQYCYRDHSKKSFLPFLYYQKYSGAYAQIRFSCEQIWKGAREIFPSSSRAGTATAIEEANIVNIYRHGIRDQLGRRQIECLRLVDPGESVSIQAITGRYYTHGGALTALSDISSPQRDGGPAKVRFLIINPVSQQAILRAIAESGVHDEIGNLLKDWSWERHRISHLYNDAWQVIETMKRRRERLKSEIELRLTPAPLTSFLLLTPRHIFIETYVYGRSTKLEKSRVLGAEYPVLEFERNNEKGDNVEAEVLQSAFNVMWDHFSIPAEKYDRDKEEMSFERNRELVLAYNDDLLAQAASLSKVS